jgi:hypothetical protein
VWFIEGWEELARTGKEAHAMERDESVEQPRKDPGPDPMSGRGSGEEEGEHASEREAEEEVLQEEDAGL